MMKDSFDTNAILFRLLNGATSINGGVYSEDDRPDDSQLEDIVVNTIAIEQDAAPQLATSNVNVYVPDIIYRIGDKSQTKANRVRLNQLAKEVMRVLRQANIDGYMLVPGGFTQMSEPNIKQHFVNIRVDWNIH